MTCDQFRDLHYAQTRTGSEIEAFQEYHFRREDSLINDSSFDDAANGCVLLHIGAPSFLNPINTRTVDVASIQNEEDRFPLIEAGEQRGERSVLGATGVTAEIDSRYDEGKAVTRIGRHGVLEAISTTIFSDANSESTKSILATEKLEKSLVALAETYHRCFSNDTDEQSLITVTYRNMENVRLTGGNAHPRGLTISDDTIRVQPSRIGSEEYREELIPVIRPLWNAAGRETSVHMAEDGWKFE